MGFLFAVRGGVAAGVIWTGEESRLPLAGYLGRTRKATRNAAWNAL
jgi:hypothetical protein